MLTGVLIKCSDIVETISVDLKNIESSIDLKGKDGLKCITIWEIDSETDYLLYGYEQGSHTIVNKHEMPAPVELNLFYGDLLVLAKNNDKLKPLTKEDYFKFYDFCFGGFESLGEESDFDNEKDDYDYEDGFLVKDE